MKLIKFLFSRMTTVGILIILQVLIFFGFAVFLKDYYLYVNVAVTIISLMVLLNIINKDVHPDNKIPWIILVLIVPFFGLVLYLLLREPVWSTNKRRKFASVYIQSKCITPTDFSPDITLALGEYVGQQSYLTATSGLIPYDHTHTTYYATGESFYRALLSDLARAKKYIFLEYFIIERGKMWNNILDILVAKVKSGVEVRVMYDDIGCINKLPSNYYKRLQAIGIKCVRFNNFLPVVSILHNNRDHRKLTIIDGLVGYCGGANIADEYINAVSPLGYWKDSTVRLEGIGVKSLTTMFLQNYYTFSKEILSFDQYIPESFPSFENAGIVQPFGDGPTPFYRDQIAENIYITMINQAREYVYITTPYLIVNHTVMTALNTAAKRGVDVRIVLPAVPDKTLVYVASQHSFLPLIKAGVKVYLYSPGFIHAKNILVDDRVAIVGTINLDYRSFTHHFECGIYMCDTPIITDIRADMDHTFEISELLSDSKARLSWCKTIVARVMQAFTPML